MVIRDTKTSVVVNVKARDKDIAKFLVGLDYLGTYDFREFETVAAPRGTRVELKWVTGSWIWQSSLRVDSGVDWDQQKVCLIV